MFIDIIPNNLVIPLKKHKYNNFIKIYNEKLLRAKERRMDKFSHGFIESSRSEPLPTSGQLAMWFYDWGLFLLL